MKEFIIEYELEKVRNKGTRKHLDEVVSSYNNDNYRAATVVLYSVVIYDLTQKLKTLSEVYSDDIAKKILEDVKRLQDANPTSPRWEKELLDMLENRTQLINKIDRMRIEHLIDDRNLAAHPIYNLNYELQSPTKEQVRAHIRNMFEIVFQKDAILSKKIVVEIVKDIADYYDKVQFEGLKRYLESKYFNKMNQLVKDELLKTLWKFLFHLDNEMCKKYRMINMHTLKHLINDDKHHYLELVRDNKEYYSRIPVTELECEFTDQNVSAEENSNVSLVYFLAILVEFYDILEDSAKVIVENTVNKNIRLTTIAYYLNGDIIAHLDALRVKHRECYFSEGWVDVNSYNILGIDELKGLLIQAKKKDVESIVYEFLVEYFINSVSYSSTKSIFSNLVSGILEDLSSENLKTLLLGMNINRQIFEVDNIDEICRQIKSTISKKNLLESFEFETYLNLPF